MSVKVAKAESAPIATEVLAVGTIWPKEKADVAAKISAQIKTMSLLKNKLVKAGEVIAVLESRDLQAQRAEALAAVNEAKANERSLVTGTIPQTNAADQKRSRMRAQKLQTHEPPMSVAGCFTKTVAFRKRSRSVRTRNEDCRKRVATC